MLLVTGLGARRPMGFANLSSVSYGRGYALKSLGVAMSLPPTTWNLPNDLNVQHPITQDGYGPCISHYKCGTLDESGQRCRDDHSVKHRTLRGTIRSQSGSICPWRTTSFGSCIDVHGTELSTLSGKPSVGYNKATLYDYDGSPCVLPTSANYPYEYYYYTSCFSDGFTCDNDPPHPLLESNSEFFIKNSTYFDPNRLWWRSNHCKVDVRFSDKDHTKIIRKMTTAYSDDSSYTPMASTSDFGDPFCVENRVENTIISLLSIKRVRPGRFVLTYSLQSSVTSRGYLYPSYYENSWQGTFGPYTCQLLTPCCGNGSPLPYNLFDSFILEESNRCMNVILPSDRRSRESANTAAIQAIDSLESNWIENINGGMGSLSSLIVPLMQGFSAYTSGDVAGMYKAISSLYLSYSYAIRPNISDANDLAQNLQYQLQNSLDPGIICRRGQYDCATNHPFGNEIQCKYTTQLHLSVKNNIFSKLWAALERLGLTLDPGHLWDLVPYSFVIDWFSSIGDVLTDLSNIMNRSIAYDVAWRCTGRKLSWPVPAAVLNKHAPAVQSCCGGVDLIVYDRSVDFNLGEFSPLDIDLSTSGLTVSQMTQGAALISNFL